MRAAAHEPQPLNVAAATWDTERYGLPPKGGRKLNFGTVEEPLVIVAPKGVDQLVLQLRRCGDVYAEINGPKLCKSSIGADTRSAVEAVFSQVSA